MKRQNWFEPRLRRTLFSVNGVPLQSLSPSHANRLDMNNILLKGRKLSSTIHPAIRLIGHHCSYLPSLQLVVPCVCATLTIELQWLERLWNHENMFETGVVRGNEC